MASGTDKNTRRTEKSSGDDEPDPTSRLGDHPGLSRRASFGGERATKASNTLAENTRKQLRMARTGATFTPALQLVVQHDGQVLLLLVLVMRGDSTAGDLVAYITAAGLLPKPIRQLSEVSSTIE